VLRAAIRPYDICVRYAGDEFIVVLSGCGAEEAERKRLELQKAVDQVQFDARPGQLLPLAISIGASIFPHDGDSYETLLATAGQPDVSRQDAAQAASIGAGSTRRGECSACGGDRKPLGNRSEAVGDRHPLARGSRATQPNPA